MVIQKTSHQARPTCVIWGKGVKNTIFRPVFGYKPELSEKPRYSNRGTPYEATTKSPPGPRNRSSARRSLPHFFCVHKVISEDSHLIGSTAFSTPQARY